MVPRPTKLALDISLKTPEDVDAALHEMGWLRSRQQQIEAADQEKIERLKAECQKKLTVEIDGQSVTFADRWNQLWDAVHKWSVKSLKSILPAGKKTAKLSHGEIKLRTMPAAVQPLEGANVDKIAKELARDAGVLKGLEELLQAPVDGVPVCKLITVKFAIAKDAIKDELDRSPQFAEVLKKRRLAVVSGIEQITVEPAAVQLTSEV